MKIRIEVDENAAEEEIIIRCSDLTEDVRLLHKMIAEFLTHKKQITFYKGEKEYYLPLSNLLFFETEGNVINAHTIQNVYQVKYKLYELEEMLPMNFIRVSKSTIVNANKIYSITRNLTASSTVEFFNSHKQIYVSRNYYKPLKNYLEEKRK